MNSLGIGYDKADILQTLRLGQRSELSKRPLLVKFSSGHVKNLLMENLYKLKGSRDELDGVIVTHDMTKSERKQCKETYEELKKKKADDASGEYIYRMRGMPGKMYVLRLIKH